MKEQKGIKVVLIRRTYYDYVIWQEVIVVRREEWFPFTYTLVRRHQYIWPLFWAPADSSTSSQQIQVSCMPNNVIQVLQQSSSHHCRWSDLVHESHSEISCCWKFRSSNWQILAKIELSDILIFCCVLSQDGFSQTRGVQAWLAYTSHAYQSNSSVINHC